MFVSSLPLTAMEAEGTAWWSAMKQGGMRSDLNTVSCETGPELRSGEGPGANERTQPERRKPPDAWCHFSFLPAG